MPRLSDEQVNELIESVNHKRKEYINSSDYARDICSVLLQKWHLISNDILAKTTNTVTEELEFMAIYQQIIDVYPEEFNGRNIEEIKRSLQKSIYGSVYSVLCENYIHNLKNNDPDSFLVIPITVTLPAKSLFAQRGTHGITLIITKQNDKIKIETYDKAQQRTLLPDREASKKELPTKVWENKSTAQISPVYTYEIENTEKNIASIVESIRIGRLHVSWWEKVNPFSGYSKNYFPINNLSHCAHNEYYTDLVATTQYVQENCGINNLNGALKHMLGKEKTVMVDGVSKKIVKFDKLTTKKFNQVYATLTIHHLEKIGFLQGYKKFIEESYQIYVKEKDRRSKLPKKQQIQRKVKVGELLNKKMWQVPAGERVDISGLDYSFGMGLSKSSTHNLYHLNAEEATYIKKLMNGLEKKQFSEVGSQVEPSFNLRVNTQPMMRLIKEGVIN